MHEAPLRLHLTLITSPHAVCMQALADTDVIYELHCQQNVTLTSIAADLLSQGATSMLLTNSAAIS
jgi:hypothetical protein